MSLRSKRAVSGLVLGLLVSVGTAIGQEAIQQPDGASKLNPTLVRRLADSTEPVKTWIFFADKAINSPAEYRTAIATVAENYDRRATWRRQMRGTATRGGELFNAYDLPVPQAYVDAVTATGARLHVTSRWLNAVSVYATAEQADAIAALPFVNRLEAVARSSRVKPVGVHPETAEPAAPTERTGRIDYGASAAQLQQINVPALHDAGFTGQNVIIGILDTGFRRDHQAFNQPGHVVNVIAEYDFVDDDPNAAPESGDPSSQHEHGTMILGCIGAYLPGQLVGGAFNASFILCKTEDTTQEVPAEEDNYVAGLEFIEAHGGDMETSSLGYIDWYTQAQLDGQTAVTTIAVNISTSLGIHHCNAAGNEYHDSSPTTSSLIAPADAFDCITVGAVDSSGTIAYFSSDGPTADGRVKPEVLARGVTTHTVDPFGTTGYTTADGTSLSTPLVACAVACLCSARPYWTVDQMRERLFTTADYYAAHGTFDPLYVRGYGIVNAFAANDFCSDAGEITLDSGKYACEDTLTIEVVDCGLDTNPAASETIVIAVGSSSETGVETVTLTETGPDAAQFVGSIEIGLTDAPGVLLIAPGDTITATYVDADDGDGHQGVTVTATAVVDCTPPVISDVHAADVQARVATIAFTSDEPVRGTVHYGLDCAALTQTASGDQFSTAPVVGISGLRPDTTYYYSVDATDEAGNATVDPVCYSFSTPDIPDYFTELFESNNDLDNLSLIFTPNGSGDFYYGCTEPITMLPTDPTGGTALTLTDDSYVSVTPGATVYLYGVAYSSFYVGSNGYLTFGTSDDNFSESLDEHFATPRIAGLFDDLDPAQGGTVSWRRLADCVVVTWLNVPEHNGYNQNTFQIEMFFDGKITINYLTISATDGLAGLSRGLGLSADYSPSDLSGLGACGPQPPTAIGARLVTPVGDSLDITLTAMDDGLPDPPAAITYVITSLPAHGRLIDPAAGVVKAVPHTLASGGNEVRYDPQVFYQGADSFEWLANDGGVAPEGGDSDPATISITVGGPQLVYNFNMDTNPGWTTEDQWAWGQPTGGGSHNLDPTSGHTGANVYGFNLAGDYASNMTVKYLTTTALDFTDVTGVELRFWRWLGVESARWDHAGIQVSNNGTTWTTVWDHTVEAAIEDRAWTQQVFDISAVADDQATVYLRWSMGATDGSVTYPGWNIDDVEFWGVVPFTAPATGDLNCDGAINVFDIDPFVVALTNPAHYAELYPECEYVLADINGDGAVNVFDIDPFVLLLTGG